MTEPTKEQLMEWGKKFLERQQKDQLRTKAVNQALGKLKATHEGEYKKYFEEAKKAFGI